MSTTVQELATDQGIVRVPTGTWKVDPTHSAVEFKIRHMMVSTVRGRFGEFEGTLEAAPDYHDSRAYGFCQVASIDTGNAQRDEHLRSPDFFDVERYPEITFRSTRVEGDSPGGFRLVGDLTVHGVTRPVGLDVEYNGWTTDPWGGRRAGFSASTEVDREDFGLTWNAAIEGGGVLVGKKARLEFEIEAVKQA